MVAAAKPDTEPTDRSISPSRSTSTMPSAMTPVGAANWVIETRLRLERNVGSLSWNTRQMTIRPKTTGSMPSSPPLRRAQVECR